MPAHQPRGRIHVQNVKFLCCEQILPFAADGEGVWSPGGPLPCKAVGRRPEGGSFSWWDSRNLPSFVRVNSSAGADLQTKVGPNPLTLSAPQETGGKQTSRGRRLEPGPGGQFALGTWPDAPLWGWRTAPLPVGWVGWGLGRDRGSPCSFLPRALAPGPGSLRTCPRPQPRPFLGFPVNNAGGPRLCGGLTLGTALARHRGRGAQLCRRKPEPPPGAEETKALGGASGWGFGAVSLPRARGRGGAGPAGGQRR